MSLTGRDAADETLVSDAQISQAQQSLDDLVATARVYQSAPSFTALLDYLRRFRRYSPFNAMLLHLQRPGSTFVLTAREWQDRHGRIIRLGARPLVILRPFGPVLLVYDVADTESGPQATALPDEVVSPFAVATATPDHVWQQASNLIVANAVRDGVRVVPTTMGSQQAGRISRLAGGSQPYIVRRRSCEQHLQIPVMFGIELDASGDPATSYATLTHELAHLYCGHLGKHADEPWPNRSGLAQDAREFEAEVTATIATWRIDPTATLPPYVHQHLTATGQVPDGFSLSRVLVVAELLTKMSAEHLSPR